MYCVYKHTVPNGKIYIGITSRNPLKRWANGHGYKDNKPFWNDIVLYGWLNIKHEVLCDGLQESEARDMEAHLICKYDSYKKEHGYNIVAGACYGYIEDRCTMSREEYLAHCKSSDYKKKCVPKEKQKVVYQYDCGGNFIAEYVSIREAARMLEVDKKCISDCINGRQKTCKGFVFIPSPGVK